VGQSMGGILMISILAAMEKVQLSAFSRSKMGTASEATQTPNGLRTGSLLAMETRCCLIFLARGTSRTKVPE
jgi:hypothetical protein